MTGIVIKTPETFEKFLEQITAEDYLETCREGLHFKDGLKAIIETAFISGGIAASKTIQEGVTPQFLEGVLLVKLQED